MQLETLIFKNKKATISKLISFGFVKKNDDYIYEKKFHNNFLAKITLTKKGIIKGKVIDLEMNEEYLPIHTSQTGKYVDTIRQEYIDILKEIASSCFDFDANALLNPKSYWLIPANPKYYDIMNAFNQTDTIIWK